MIDQLKDFIASEVAAGNTRTVTDAYGQPLVIVPYDAIHAKFGPVDDVIAEHIGAIANAKQTKEVAPWPQGALLVWEDETTIRRMKVIGLALMSPENED
jgi:hypothetical protein